MKVSMWFCLLFSICICSTNSFIWKKKSHNYKVTVKVSDSYRAGTDANVYVRLTGKRTSDACRDELDKVLRDDFRRGSTETYTLHDCHDDLGRLTEVEIGYTPFLLSVDRDLEIDWVKVEDVRRQEFYLLNCAPKPTCKLQGKEDKHIFKIERGCGPGDQLDNHSAKCLRKLWLQAGCSILGTHDPESFTIPEGQLQWWRKHTLNDVSKDMRNFHMKAVGSYKYNKLDWRKFFNFCFGPVEGCGSWGTYGPHSGQCIQNLWRLVGCDAPKASLPNMWDKVTVWEALRVVYHYADENNDAC